MNRANKGIYNQNDQQDQRRKQHENPNLIILIEHIASIV